MMVLRPFPKLHIALNEPKNRVRLIYGVVYVSIIDKYEKNKLYPDFRVENMCI